MNVKDAIKQLNDLEMHCKENADIDSQHATEDDEYSIWEEDVKALDIGIYVLEKQLPKKTITSKYNGVDGIKYEMCPGCEYVVYGSRFCKKEPFCCKCGQKIDWD